jgi:hypothetical protein
MSNNYHSVDEAYFVVPSKNGNVPRCRQQILQGLKSSARGDANGSGYLENTLRKIFSFDFDGSFPFGCSEHAARPHRLRFLERLMLSESCTRMQDPNGPEGEKRVLLLQWEGP